MIKRKMGLIQYIKNTSYFHQPSSDLTVGESEIDNRPGFMEFMNVDL